MSYLITNIHNVLVLKLSTKDTDLILNTYINGSSGVQNSYERDASSTDELSIFRIPLSDYELNDSITKFKLVSSSNKKLYETQEGVVVLLDGEMIDTGKVTTSGGTDTLVKDTDGNMVTEDRLSNNKFYLNFTDGGSHDLQAVYRGNDGIAMVMTEKTHFQVKQPDLDESGSLDNDGAYLLEFVDNTFPSFYYNDGKEIYFRLTKGGVPVPNRTVQRQYPSGGVGTGTTDSQGLVKITNTGYKAGKYKIGAFFYVDTVTNVISSTYRNMEIKKGTPVWTDNFEDEGEFIKGSKYKAKLKYRGKAMENVKVTVQVNKNKITKTTSKYGVVSYDFKSKGTYNIKVIYKGDENHNQVELSRSITIKE